MRAELRLLIRSAVETLLKDRSTGPDEIPAWNVERTRQKAHGDFACNVALVLAKPLRSNPKDVAQALLERLPESPLVGRTEIAGPGFINLYLTSGAYWQVIDAVRSAGATYGHSDLGRGRNVLVEFVSANPTGPLHVGHGRGAAYGDALVRVLRSAGYDAKSEYYINDAGRQMDILALSVWLRYLELCGELFTFPGGLYRGDYVFDIAAALHREWEADGHRRVEPIMQNLPIDSDAAIDTMIERAQHTLGEDRFDRIHALATDTLVNDIRSDLSAFAVDYDRWFSEKSLSTSGAIDRVIKSLKDNGYLYEKDHAQWFRSTDFGDEKDRVVIRANGKSTYFASDIAYHFDKLERGFDETVNIWGADHHGYISRVKASLSALGCNPDALVILLVQFAVLYRGKRKISMSTRGGDFVTLRQLRSEVGTDAARFFYVLRKPEQHMDFDLELATSQSTDNPVYYVQYAHARICSVFRQLADKGIEVDLLTANHQLLNEERELDLLRALSHYPEVIEAAAKSREPHQVAYFLRELANDFHSYYNAHPFIAAEEQLRLARLSLIDATRQVIANGLLLLGVAAPSSM
ncbi:MAG: arginine--tRNA ligase [Pseudomonadota bacterium]|nr:arginine--tRNA ligase [Pseudomonadota bacterium]